jgi:hypothetical protein
MNRQATLGLAAFLTRGYRIAQPVSGGAHRPAQETFSDLRGDVLPTPFASFKLLLETIQQLLGGPGGLGADATHSLPPQFHAAFQRKALPISAPSPLHHLQNYARAIDDNAFAHTTTQSLHLAGLAQHAQGRHDKMQVTDTLGQGNDARRMGRIDPLFDVKRLPCWPLQPLWGQLKDGAKLKASRIDFESEKDVPTGLAYRAGLSVGALARFR